MNVSAREICGVGFVVTTIAEYASANEGRHGAPEEQFCCTVGCAVLLAALYCWLRCTVEYMERTGSLAVLGSLANTVSYGEVR